MHCSHWLNSPVGRAEKWKPEGGGFKSHLSHRNFQFMDKLEEGCNLNYFLRMLQV